MATAALALLAVLAAVPAAAKTPVDLLLALAVDVSRSVDEEEARLQRQGYIEAFRDPEVVAAIRTGMLGRIAVGYFEWAGEGSIAVVSDWTLIESAADAQAFADSLTQQPPRPMLWTSISGAIDFAVPWLDRSDFEGTRKVIDISGDGPNNSGDLVVPARDRAIAAGVTINGLPIMDMGTGMYTAYNIRNLDLYYRDCVIGGPGAFLIVAENFNDFARAVRRKLILEIANRTPQPAGHPVRIVPAQTGPDYPRKPALRYRRTDAAQPRRFLMPGDSGNLFSGLPEGVQPREALDVLLAGSQFRLVRIVSTGQATPEGEWYDQAEAEWVVLLKGAAGLRFADEAAERVMGAGDWVSIPAHRRHRVEWTAPDEPTVWLALHCAVWIANGDSNQP